MHVLITAPVHSGQLYIPAAKEMDTRISVITTGTGDQEIPESLQSQIDELVIVDELTLETLTREALRIHDRNPITAIAAGYEFIVESTAYLAHLLGVPGLDPKQVDIVRNKAKTRARLQEAGVRTVKFAKAGTATDLEHAAASVGFPAVIKPLDMAGSIGVVRVNDPVELLAAYEDILNEKEGMGGRTPTNEVLLEEFLVGTEYCVDGYVTQDGEVHVMELVKVELGPQPHFQEIGYTSYRAEDLPFADELIAYLTQVVKATYITVGPFHSEVMMTKDGPILIEIANRLPGDDLPLLTERATGISFAKCALAALFGIPIPGPAVPPARVAASQFVIAPELAGETYSAIEGWETIVNQPNIDSAKFSIAPEQKIPVAQDCRSRLAEIQFHADSVEAAEAFRKQMTETLRVIR